ncbi:hypothetical protein HUG17_6827 [Dermatophagoides farinae]|uniref:Uncharacterized protein n=1 Tax=Dermatophagoides farinae TaxID=6954 RepID=A0A9D4SCH4_DERFA|nr:hypothetical protein HUG17_6827 [Dermatophagoides farinae]
MRNATPNPLRSFVEFNRTTTTTTTPSLSRDESQTFQRPVFVTFVRLVTACFVSIGDKSMNFNQRTKMEDVWKKLNSQ